MKSEIKLFAERAEFIKAFDNTCDQMSLTIIGIFALIATTPLIIFLVL